MSATALLVMVGCLALLIAFIRELSDKLFWHVHARVYDTAVLCVFAIATVYIVLHGNDLVVQGGLWWILGFGIAVFVVILVGLFVGYAAGVFCANRMAPRIRR